MIDIEKELEEIFEMFTDWGCGDSRKDWKTVREYKKKMESIIKDIHAMSKQFNHIHTDEIESIIKGGGK